MATMRELQDEVARYLEAKGKNWTHADNHCFRMTYLVEEVGELARSIINVEARIEEPNRRGLNESREAKLEKVKDALGDILYHIFGISSEYGIDAEEAFRTAMRSIKQRYPV